MSERKSSSVSFGLKCVKRKLISLVSVGDAKLVELLQWDHVENVMSKMCICQVFRTSHFGETDKNSSRSCVYLQCDTNTQQNTHAHTQRLSRVLWKLAGRCEGWTWKARAMSQQLVKEDDGRVTERHWRRMARERESLSCGCLRALQCRELERSSQTSALLVHLVIRQR